MSDAPFRCADAARGRGDPGLGTAPQTRRWLLIEHPGPWRRDAVAGSLLLEPLRDALLRPPPLTRVLLVRRHGRGRAGHHARSWAVVETGSGTVRGEWSQAADLAEAVRRLAADEPVVGPTDPLLLVCTHGVHDQCCAVRGRPVATVLDERWRDATWECSHLGGDRFAANVLVLPDGALYGNLDAASAPSAMADHLAGRPRIDLLRGAVALPPIAQVAVGAVHEQLGPLSFTAVGATSVTRTQRGWRVGVTVDGRPVGHVEVATAPRPAAVLTCHAARPTSALGYTVVAVDLS